MEYPSIREIPANTELDNLAIYLPHIVYSKAGGEDLTLEIMMPMGGRDMMMPGMEKKPPKKRFPLIVFLQGSGWTCPNFTFEFTQLAQFARAGYVVASIAAHRNIMKGAAAPAYLIDAKTAVRFLRANADDYCIDPARVCFWGSSSGGNTAQLVAVTGDDPKYKSEEYADQSDTVQAAVSCFGPSDMEAMFAKQGNDMDKQRDWMRNGFIGKDGDESVIAAMSPLRLVKKGNTYPPMLLAHGAADSVVLFSQSENMFHAYVESGNEAQLIRVPGANHEGVFWSKGIFDAIQDFIDSKLK